MTALRTTKCQIGECDAAASAMAVLGTQFYCVEPMSPDPRSAGLLLRLDLCDEHIALLGANFTEIQHDPRLSNYSDVGGFEERRSFWGARR